jgi:hypothetical protein
MLLKTNLLNILETEIQEMEIIESVEISIT